MPGPYGVVWRGEDERGKGGRQPAPLQLTGGCPKTGGNTQPVGTLQASQARPAPLMGSLLRAAARDYSIR